MKFTNQVKVLGMKSSKGAMDNGQTFDSTKVYTETQLDESKGTAKGFAGAEYTFGTSIEFDKFRHLPFPFEADADFEIVSNGKTMKTVMLALRPVKVAASGKA